MTQQTKDYLLGLVMRERDAEAKKMIDEDRATPEYAAAVLAVRELLQ